MRNISEQATEFLAFTLLMAIAILAWSVVP